MWPCHAKRGLTRVEVLAIVAVVLVIAALLPRWSLRSREQTRRITCVSNLSQITLAAFNYEAAAKFFPGYHQKVDKTQIDAGWPVFLLPYMDRKDVWKVWSNGNQVKLYIKYFGCPSDPPDVINQGVDGPSSYQANGFLFRDGQGMSLDYVITHKGAGTTLLLSENLRRDKAHNWWDTTQLKVSFGCRDPYPATLAGNIESNHGGGSVVTFCDRHSLFLRSDVDDVTYGQLCDPVDTTSIYGAPLDESKLE
jgi:hypothetical protein